MLVDSHCHLDYFKEEERDEIIQNALASNVKIMQTISTKFSQREELMKIVNAYDFIYASIGTHPENAHDDFVTASQMVEFCKSHKKIIGIGETGLDYYHSTEFKQKQKSAFEEHIKAALETGKPIIVHTRNADDDTLAMLKEPAKNGLKILMHCFTGGAEFAKKLLDIGAFISYSGIVTFKNAASINESMMATPQDRLIIETDAPFLAPAPMRGKRNEPAFVKYTAQFIAEKRGISVEEVATLTAKNFFRLFNID